MGKAIEIIQLIFVAIGGFVGWFIGGVDGFMYALISFVIIDYVTGLMVSIISKKVSSEVGFKGIFKKVIIFLLIGIAHMIDIYVITLASNPQNLLDVIQAQELMQKAYPKKELFIIGLARGYDEALELVKQIVDEVYQRTGGFDVSSYLNEKKDSVNY